MKYRKKTLLLEATQWLENGDHPQDESVPIQPADGAARLTEGKVVQYYPWEVTLENRFCPNCGNLLARHGFLNGANGEEIVCPGDYIVTNRHGFYYRLQRGEFESQYERYAPPPRPTRPEKRLSDLEQLKLQRKTEKHGGLSDEET